MGIKIVPHRPYSPDLAPCDFCLFPKLRGCRYETVEEMNSLWRRSLTRSHKRTSMGPSRSCWNGTTSALQPEEITSKGTRVSCVLSIKVPIRKKSGNLFHDPHMCCQVFQSNTNNYMISSNYFCLIIIIISCFHTVI